MIDEGLERALSGTDTVHATDAAKKDARVGTLVCWCVSSEPGTR